MNIAILLFIIIIIIYFLTILLFIKASTSVKPIINVHTPQDLGLPYSDVTLTTQDYYKIHGWLIETPSADKTILLIHGFGTNREDLLPYAQLFYHQKCNIFMIDLRGHGNNTQIPTTFGIQEKYDLLAAIHYLKSIHKDKIYILGHSMGGVITLLTISTLQDPAIKALIIDSSFYSLEQMIQERLERHIPYPVSLPHIYFSKLLSKYLYAIDVHQVTPGKASLNIDIPILMFHSLQDRTVTYKNSLLYARLQKKNIHIHTLENIGHDNHLSCPQYQEALLQFISIP